jgi:membrane associated rhomboid family serine protease
MLPIPIGTDRPQRHLPWMNYAIIAVNVICYALSHANTEAHGAAIGNFTGLAPGWDQYMLYPTHLRLEQFITYQFLHENLSHIFFNMLFLYVFGNNLNEKLGNAGYLAFYLAGGVLAGCGQVLSSSAPTLGASGAISAVTGLFLVLLPRTNIRIFIWIFVYVDFWEIPSVYFIVFSILKDFLEPLLWGGASQTAHAAHLSGNFAGVAIGLLLLLTGLVQRDHYDLLAMINRWRRRKQYESLVAGGYDPYSPTVAVSKKGWGKNASPAAIVVNPRVAALREEILQAIGFRNVPSAVVKYLELRTLDPQQVLPPDAQLDIANQLMADAKHEAAASAYEDYLRVYKTGGQHDQVMLLLGVIYAHYLVQPAKALELFRGALPRLHDQKQKQWAEEEIAHLASSTDPPTPEAGPFRSKLK